MNEVQPMPMRVSALLLLSVLFLMGPGAALAQQAPATDAEGVFNIGLMHLREGRSQMALDQFKKAIRMDGKNPYFHKGIGLAYLRMNKFDEAIESLKKALEINPYYTDVHNDLGAAYAAAGKRAEAKAEFLTAYNDATNPTPEFAARNLCQANFEDKAYAEAINWCQAAVTRNKSYPDAYLLLADSLAALGKGDEAILQLEGGLKEAPENACILSALGEMYQQAGRFSDARTKLQDAARRDPGGPCGIRAMEAMKNLPAANPR